MRLLLVEDVDDLRRLFARVLTRSGFEVRQAADGHEALDQLVAFVPDVVVTDLMMPGMDGFELIRRIRATSGLAEVPIVAMTANATPEAEREARRAGAADLMAKPVDMRTLLAHIGEACHA